MRSHTAFTTVAATTIAAFALTLMGGVSASAAVSTSAAPAPEVPWTAPAPKGSLTVVVELDEVPWT
ncbi:hypothetical protein [Streptomyces sp. NBC_00091]|uniref:hypothetical protein n=1 Tax=Streptomyces sp. NBC_00091 TaxID=2975648 RepID=UPI002251C37D|nr:hypothetical protein [Streptomyces sp. NBC_00091]MCX5375316.1 hypothetical protein [Streptomyces sp. NBC_00091]